MTARGPGTTRVTPESPVFSHIYLLFFSLDWSRAVVQSGESITFWNPDYDKPCAPALIALARKNKTTEIPDWLGKFESTKAAKQWRVEDIDKALQAAAVESGAGCSK